MEIPLEFFSNPDEAFRNIKSKPDARKAAFWALGAWVSACLGALQLPGIHLSPLAFAVILSASGLMLLPSIYLKSLLLHSITRISGGTGDRNALFAMFAFCLMPFYLLLPLSIILRNSVLLMPPVFIGIVSWAAVLGIKAIKENYSYTIIQAVCLGLAPAIILLIFLLIFFFAAAAMLALKLILTLLKFSALL